MIKGNQVLLAISVHFLDNIMGVKHHAKFKNIILLIKLVVSSPNIVLILTDDQDLLLDGLVRKKIITYYEYKARFSSQMPMKKTQELLVNQGKMFVNAVSK